MMSPVWLLLAILEGLDVTAVAHRGALREAPENTIAAFEAATRHGAGYVEVDVRQTRDGALVLMHDGTVDRTTNGKGAVAELTLAELRLLDAGRGERIPTLRETLEWGRRRNVKIDIDHKAGAIEAIAAEIRETGMASRVVIEGSRENLRHFAGLLPGADTMPKVDSPSDVAEACRQLKTGVVRLSLAQIEQPEMVRAVRQCPARISVTILGRHDTVETLQRVIALGANLIETDYPERVAAALRSR